jgi:tRNA1Val (adenine37-N6)-methyltransferase
MDADQITSDHLGRHSFRQPRQGYRFSIDSVLLADFCALVSGPVADLGAGCGVLCILLKAKGLSGPFTAVEIDPLAAECCRRNLKEAGLNGMVLNHDLTRPHKDLAPAGFALVVSNPPFTREGHGRLPPDPARARARHELSLNCSELWAQAAKLLPAGGRFVFCWPPARLVEALSGLPKYHLTPKRLRLVHGRQDRPASLALMEAIKDGGDQLTVEPPLIVYSQGQQHSSEVSSIYRRLCGPEAEPA